ncbi:hypothetical protein ACRYCC_27200 [Actinomadura scrupuli]|uniref:hypothetical protein n=1 Tax=Actinomadura scrupuli TaxID=559629 RepID=UPI003D992FA5
MVVAGAHGGAGTTTLSALLGAAWDMGSVLDPDPAYAPVRAHGRPLIVVCRNSVPAARHATRAVTALHACGERISALAIVSDGAGGEPADASTRFALLEGRVGGTVRIPFVPALRLVDDPNGVALPGRARRALANLTDLITNQPQAPKGPLSITTTQEAPCPF